MPSQQGRREANSQGAKGDDSRPPEVADGEIKGGVNEPKNGAEDAEAGDHPRMAATLRIGQKLFRDLAIDELTKSFDEPESWQGRRGRAFDGLELAHGAW